MTTLETAIDEFDDLLEQVLHRVGGTVAALYRKSVTGGYDPILWAPHKANLVPPHISQASDLAAFLRAQRSPSFVVSQDMFTDGLVRSRVRAFGATSLLTYLVPDERESRYYLCVGVWNEVTDKDVASLAEVADELRYLLTRTELQVKIRLPQVSPAASDTKASEATKDQAALALIRETLDDGSFECIAETLAEANEWQAQVLLEDANGRVLARWPQDSELPLALTWLLEPPRLPYLDRMEESGSTVIVPACYDELGIGRIVIPLCERGDLLGAISVTGEMHDGLGELLEAARFGTIHLLRCREASRGRVLRDSLTSVENERVRVAFELHDDTSQNLVALKVHLSTAQRALTRAAYDQAAGLMEDSNRIADEILDDVNELSRQLRPSELNYLGLQPAIDAEATVRLTPAGIAHRFSGNALDARLNPLQETMLLSGVVAALSNCAKYSHAQCVDIEIDNDGSWFTLAIRDDGVGFNATDDRLTGYGLKTMSDCAESIGGDFWIGSMPGVGTTVRFSIPVRLLEEE